MNKPLKFIAIVALLTIMTSCAAIRESQESGKAVNTTALKIGMSKDEVQQVLQKKPYGIVAARNYPENHTTIEVVQYTQDGAQGTILDNYWLYFINGKLDRWERSDPKRTPII